MILGLLGHGLLLGEKKCRFPRDVFVYWFESLSELEPTKINWTHIATISYYYFFVSFYVHPRFFYRLLRSLETRRLSSQFNPVYSYQRQASRSVGTHKSTKRPTNNIVRLHGMSICGGCRLQIVRDGFAMSLYRCSNDFELE